MESEVFPYRDPLKSLLTPLSYLLSIHFNIIPLYPDLPSDFHP